MKLDTVKMDIYKKYLKFKFRKGKLRGYIRKISRDRLLSLGSENNLGSVYKISPKEKGNELIVAALQIKVLLYDDIGDFMDKMNELVFKAVQGGAQLIVFPENNLSQLLGLFPGIKSGSGIESGKENEGEKGDDSLLTELDEDIKISDILGFTGKIIKKISSVIFSELASRYKVYIMSGTGMFPANKGIFNTGFLYGPDGALIGQQKKTHLMPQEREWGLKRGDKLDVFDTNIGRLALPVCMDASYFESFRILTIREAEIVMVPISNPDPEYNYWTAMRGIWGRVQESGVYGVKSALVGQFLGFTFTGQAGIYAPLEMTGDQSGIVLESRSADQEEVLTAKLDLQLLRKYRLSAERLNNKKLWERYYPQVYYSVKF